MQIPHNRRVRAALLLRQVPVTLRSIALKHGANEKTVSAALKGDRPGNDPKVRAAVAEAKRLARGVAA